MTNPPNLPHDYLPDITIGIRQFRNSCDDYLTIQNKKLLCIFQEESWRPAIRLNRAGCPARGGLLCFEAWFWSGHRDWTDPPSINTSLKSFRSGLYPRLENLRTASDFAGLLWLTEPASPEWWRWRVIWSPALFCAGERATALPGRILIKSSYSFKLSKYVFFVFNYLYSPAALCILIKSSLTICRRFVGGWTGPHFGLTTKNYQQITYLVLHYVRGYILWMLCWELYCGA